MAMIEVDPKLFVICRLCLEDVGVYQIIPEVQKKIQYCFDLNISLFDGLPQLICKKCESLLSQHAKIKEMLHEKQKTLIVKLKGNASYANEENDDTTCSTQQNDSEDDNSDANRKIANKKHNGNKSDGKRTDLTNKTPVPLQNDNKSVGNKHDLSRNQADLKEITLGKKSSKKEWRKNYMKRFVCKFCSTSVKHKRSMVLHGEKCALLRKYSNMLKYCWVNLQNFNAKHNLTDSLENVVCDKSKIVNSRNPNYYILYSLKQSAEIDSESSDVNFTSTKRNRKRQRLLSMSSNETLVLDSQKDDTQNNATQNEINKNNFINKDNSDIECVTLDDSDTVSTISVLTTTNSNSDIGSESAKNKKYEKMISNIVSICYSKYMKTLNISRRNSKNENYDSFLQRKLLSMGRKIIHKEGVTPTGLLRYMEQKDLDVVWIEKMDANVSVRTTYKENKNDDDATTWKSLSQLDSSYKPKDFIDLIEELSSSESNSTNNILSAKTKIVNNTQDVQNVVCNGAARQQYASLTPSNDKQSSKSKDKETPDNLLQQTNERERTKIEKNVSLARAIKEGEKCTMLKKLLNANPVPNPKKLCKKNNNVDTASTSAANVVNDEETVPNQEPVSVNSQQESDDCLHMPIITSTVSLAQNFNNQTHNEKQQPCPSTSQQETTSSSASSVSTSYVSTVADTNLPRIKVKPVSELMAETSLQPKGVPVSTTVWAGSTTDLSNVYFQTLAPNIQIRTIPVFATSTITYPQTQPTKMQSFVVTSNIVPKDIHQASNNDYIVMHTVELPNKKTSSPFSYVKDLMLIHKLNLIDGDDAAAASMCSIIKFKMVFAQADSAIVSLYLTLLCNEKSFSIQVCDSNSKILNVYSFSAYWQWEILKGFRGDVIVVLLTNAKKLSNDIYVRTKYFLSLLGTIVVSRE